MDVKTVFPNLNVMWVRWSDYTLVTSEFSGPRVSYLVPAPGAAELRFNCAEQSEQLVADALELGRQLLIGTPEGERLCAAFAARHGLLGLGAEKDPPSTSDPVAPPCYRPLNSREYGEDIGLFQVFFMELYQHFLTTKGEVTMEANPAVLDISGLLSYRLTSGQTPQLVWQVKSMESVIRLSYAAMVTGDKPGLRVCKNCGKVYYNSHAKSEFCGARCRNYYNVKVFRTRDRDIETRKSGEVET